MDIPNPVAAGRRLRALRLRERARATSESARQMWSIAGVAAQIGAHPATVCRLENGKFSESDYLKPLCDLYGVPIDYVLYGEVMSIDEAEIHELLTNILMLPPSDVAKVSVIVQRMLDERKKTAQASLVSVGGA